MLLSEIKNRYLNAEYHYATGGLDAATVAMTKFSPCVHPRPYGNIFEMTKLATCPSQTRPTIYPSSFPLSPFAC